MPTGYTSQLTEMKYDLNRWLTDAIPRAFGIFCNLRDTGHMTTAQLLRQLDPENSPDIRATQKSLRLAEQKVERMLAWTYGDWVRKYAAKVRQMTLSAAKVKREFTRDREQHLNALQRVKELQRRANSEFITNILKFAREQLELVIKDEYTTAADPYTPDEDDVCDVAGFRQASIDDAEEDVKYYQHALATEKAKLVKAQATYRELLSFVHARAKKA